MQRWKLDFLGGIFELGNDRRRDNTTHDNLVLSNCHAFFFEWSGLNVCAVCQLVRMVTHTFKFTFDRILESYLRMWMGQNVKM